MTTNKYTATRTTSTGNTIEVTVENGTWDENINLDGWDTGSIKTHLIHHTNIAIKDGSKILTSADTIRPLGKFDKSAPVSAIAKLGNAYIGQKAHDLIVSAIAEAEANAPKTARQIEIETAEAELKARQDAWEKSPEGIAERKEWEEYERFTREMERPDSDY